MVYIIFLEQDGNCPEDVRSVQVTRCHQVMRKAGMGEWVKQCILCSKSKKQRMDTLYSVSSDLCLEKSVRIFYNMILNQ